MESIKKSIQCKYCLKTIEMPILLPCGDSICEKHVTDKTIFCCSIEHKEPPNGFPHNKALLSLLQSEIENLKFGELYDSTLKMCQDLNIIIESFLDAQDHSILLVDELVSSLKNEINLKREEMKMKIDQTAENLLLDLENFNHDCESNFSISKIMEPKFEKN